MILDSEYQGSLISKADNSFEHFAVSLFVLLFFPVNRKWEIFVDLMSAIFDNSKVNKRLYCLHLYVFLCHRKKEEKKKKISIVCLSTSMRTMEDVDRRHWHKH